MRSDGVTAVGLWVGGSTEVEVKERKDRVDDALHATPAAVEEGIVPGGGVALARSSMILAKLQDENDDQRFGIEIVRKAVQMRLSQIADGFEWLAGRRTPLCAHQHDLHLPQERQSGLS